MTSSRSGGSAGSIETLANIVNALPRSFPGAVFTVVHMQPDKISHLAEILDRGALPAIQVTGRHPIEPGTVYVASPDTHMLD